MDQKRLHPMVAIAAVSVTLVSLAGVAAITGLIPTSSGSGVTQTPEPAVTAKNAAINEPRTHVMQGAAAPAQAVARASAACATCGQVVAVNAVQHKAASGSGLGAATGAVLGGLIGNQFGGGNGRTLATVAGAVGGGVAGNEVEKNAHSSTSWVVRVRMDDGTVRNFNYGSTPGFQAGDPVQIVNGQLTMRG